LKRAGREEGGSGQLRTKSSHFQNTSHAAGLGGDLQLARASRGKGKVDTLSFVREGNFVRPEEGGERGSEQTQGRDARENRPSRLDESREPGGKGRVFFVYSVGRKQSAEMALGGKGKKKSPSVHRSFFGIVHPVAADPVVISA